MPNYIVTEGGYYTVDDLDHSGQSHSALEHFLSGYWRDWDFYVSNISGVFIEFNVVGGDLSVHPGNGFNTLHADYSLRTDNISARNSDAYKIWSSSDPVSGVILTGRSFNAFDITTGSGDDELTGGDHEDTLRGGEGNDTLVGLQGSDWIIGEGGNDNLWVGDYFAQNTLGLIDAIDHVSGGLGYDAFILIRIRSELNFTIDAAVLASATGGTLVDGTHVDTVERLDVTTGSGNDTFVVDNGTSGHHFDGSGGYNTLIANYSNRSDDLRAGHVVNGGVAYYITSQYGFSVSNFGDLISSQNVSKFDITGGAGADIIWGRNLGDALSGGEGNDILFGAMGDDTLNGGGGADEMRGDEGADNMLGGSGDDTYFVDNAGDVVSETGGGGIDLVEASVSFTLGLNVEKLYLLGTDNLTGVGNSGGNTLTGNEGNNRLDGKSGVDTMSGGNGDDTYAVDALADVVNELANQGADTIETALDYILGANIEGLTLLGTGNKNGTGNELNNTLRGNSGANALKGLGGSDFIDGGLGADRMYGGIGDDTYVVDNVADLVVENAGEGTDEVQTSLSYILGTNLESLTLTGAGDLTGTGNSLANTLNGNAGANRLDGKSGVDTMSGGLGNDTYVVDNVGDALTELSGDGTDTVETTLDYTLGGNLENLTLTGSRNANGIGNGLNNALTGNARNNILKGLDGADTIDGAGGTDSLYGGLGPDTFVFKLGSGTDFIRDFSVADNDTIDIHAYTAGITNTALLTTVGANTLIDLGGGNTITVVGIVSINPGLLSHIVW